jgi:hypothetical protein
VNDGDSKPTSKLDVGRVQMATHFGRRHLDEWIAAAERAWADKDRDERIAAQKCRWCFYARGRGGRIVGHGFTTRACASCEAPQTYSSTAANPLCMPCAQRLGLCVECCADIDLTDRRKLELVSKPKRKRRQ